MSISCLGLCCVELPCIFAPVLQLIREQVFDGSDDVQQHISFQVLAYLKVTYTVVFSHTQSATAWLSLITPAKTASPHQTSRMLAHVCMIWQKGCQSMNQTVAGSGVRVASCG